VGIVSCRIKTGLQAVNKKLAPEGLVSGYQKGEGITNIYTPEVKPTILSRWWLILFSGTISRK
jgi:hypothetical protein